VAVYDWGWEEIVQANRGKLAIFQSRLTQTCNPARSRHLARILRLSPNRRGC